jgi:uncharacterized membrane protein
MRKFMVLLIMSFLVLALQVTMFFLETLLNVQNDYSMIIWNFAISIVIVIVAMTILKYRKKKRKKKENKKTLEVYKTEDRYRTE